MSTRADAVAGTQDRVRQAVVLLGAVAAIVGAAWGAGAFGGTPIQDAANGALAADATLLAPASGAFGIWSVIYAGLAAFAIVQALPSRAADPRMRALGWPVLASMVLNAAWIGVIQAGLLWVSVVVIAALVAVLVRIALILVASRPTSWLDRAVADVTVGLYLGWATVATVANITAAGVASLGADADAGTGIAAGVLVVVAVITAVIARGSRGSFPLSVASGLAMAWGLGWIAYGRAEGQPESLLVMWAAGLAACVAFAAPFAVRDFSRPSPDDIAD
ncbi:tryptophan-rich sensory protein [uncultured Demequina sp.]|uniref:tryptophan-rich sensory protein n=1 Tax=uncultured Demequina sp. TaxID=693499 RepID=UPI0025F50BD1|nr:tryptophan-rich sensory protein [uncultured Demequina sp.]